MLRIIDLIDKYTLLFLQIILLCSACTTPSNSTSYSESTQQFVSTNSGLRYKVIEPGTGPAAKAGDMALIHETAKLANGTIIADTWEMNHPVLFLIGGNQVIEGINEAVTGMRVGERRSIIVPPSLSERTSYPDNGLFGPEDTLYYNVILIQLSEP